MYAVTAQVEHTDHDGWTWSRQVPTFYLHPNVQGLRDANHATTVAADIIDPEGSMRADDRYNLHIGVTRVDL